MLDADCTAGGHLQGLVGPVDDLCETHTKGRFSNRRHKAKEAKEDKRALWTHHCACLLDRNEALRAPPIVLHVRFDLGEEPAI